MGSKGVKKTDRLFKIVEHLKARRNVVKAEELASLFSVSLRTIYRDMSHLYASGVPIIAEAGIGYTLDRDHIVKPLVFSLDEIDALAMGAQMVKSFGEDSLKKSITHAMNRIITSLPNQLKEEYENTFILARNLAQKTPIKVSFSDLQSALRKKRFIQIEYTDLKNTPSERTVRPLCIVYFGPSWVLLAWCEKRQDFRSFRIDRIERVEILEKTFRAEKGKRFVDFCDLHGYSKDVG
jgi:predicted DNA-binding transcriptional regulator YafY